MQTQPDPGVPEGTAPVLALPHLGKLLGVPPASVRQRARVCSCARPSQRSMEGHRQRMAVPAVLAFQGAISCSSRERGHDYPPAARLDDGLLAPQTCVLR